MGVCVNSDALAFLADKGLSLDEIIQFARIAERKADPTNAERQARYRAKRKAAKDGGDVTRDSNGVTPPNDNISNPPSDYPSEAKASLAPRGKPKSKAARLPDDWEPEPLTGETAAMVAPWPVGMIERELSKFKNYWKSASGRKAAKVDWQAAWRFWLTNADDWKPKNDRQQQRNPASTVDAVQRAIELTGGSGGRGASGTPSGDSRIGAVPDPVRAIGHVQR